MNIINFYSASLPISKNDNVGFLWILMAYNDKSQVSDLKNLIRQ